MLLLHCGWPRTSTTSLQTALYEHRELLARDGIVYPDKWRSSTGLTHHGLAEVLTAALGSDVAFDEVEQFLGEHSHQDILFSAEILTQVVAHSPKRQALLRLMGIVRRVMPVKLIWTLRRTDDFVNSLFLQRLKQKLSLQRQGPVASAIELPRPFDPGMERTLDRLFWALQS